MLFVRATIVGRERDREGASDSVGKRVRVLVHFRLEWRAEVTGDFGVWRRANRVEYNFANASLPVARLHQRITNGNLH